MKKLLSSIIGGALGLALAAGVGVSLAAGRDASINEASAAATPYAQAIFNSTNNKSSVSSYSNSWTNTTDGFSWTVANFNNNNNAWNYVKCGSKNNASVGSITTQKAVSVAISSVSITIDAITANSVNSITLYGGTNATTSLGTFTKATGTQTVTISSPAMNHKYKISFDCKQGSNNGLVTLSNVSLYQDSSSATLTGIEIKGSLTKTSYTYGDAWSRAGLTIEGTYSNGTTAEVPANTATWSYSPGIAIDSVNQLTVTASVQGFSASHTEAVTVSKVASPFLNGVAYKMYLNNGTSDYYFTGSMSGYYGASSTTESNAVSVYFQAHDDGQDLYFLNGSTKNYIYPLVNDTHINFQYSTTAPTNAWYYNGHTIAYYLSAKDCCYTPGNYGSNTTFAMFASYYSDDYYAQFKLVSALTAEQFATQLLDVIACDGTGETAPTLNYNYTWADLKALYNQLGTSAQSTLKSTSANPDGTTIENAMARYDIVVAKYGYENFISRVVSSPANRMNLVVDSNTMIIVISVVSIISAAALAAYFILRKKKEA